MILFRDIGLNVNQSYIDWLNGAIHHYLKQIDPEFKWGAIGTTQMKAQYLDLAPPFDKQIGKQIMLTFWAWGDTESEVESNLGRLFDNLREAIQSISEEIKAGKDTTK